MLKIDDIRVTTNGYTVHGDDQSPTTFYVFPKGPSFARAAEGGIQLRFVEYEQLRITEEDQFGGFVVFTTDLALPVADEQAVRAELQELVNQRAGGQEAPKVTLAPINWTGGTVQLLLSEGGALVEKIHSAAIPSLYGNNVACFALELSDIGTSVFKATLESGARSLITVVYQLEFFGRLPETHVWGTWSATKAMTFAQEVDYEENTWSEDSYTETIHSSRYSTDVTKTGGDFVDNPNLSAEENAKLQDTIRSGIQKQLADAVARNVLAAVQEVDPNVASLYDDQDFENIKRTISNVQVADVRVEWKESRAIEITKSPQGQLPTVASMKDADGAPLKWEDYYTKVSADEFFKVKRVAVRVNASFDTLPLHSVAVRMTYPYGATPKTDTLTFTAADEVEHFESLVVEGKRDVKYTYTVNYKNSAFTYTSQEITEEGDEIIINVDDLGILALDVAADGVDFERVPRAQLTLRYDGGTPVVKTLNLTKDAPNAAVLEIIKEARTRPIDYEITYSLADGRDVKGTPGQVAVGQKALSVADPFAAPRTITFRAVGDLTTVVESVTFDAVYTDPENDYTQRKTVVLTSAMPFLEWSFPVFDDTAGSVTYSGTIARKDGTSEPFGPTTTTASVIEGGDVVRDFLEVTIQTPLIDWTKVKVVLVNLAYVDEDNDVSEKKDWTFTAPTAEAPVWKVPLKDKTRTGYTSTITFFLLDGTRRTVGPTPETGTTVFPELPAA